jgi:S1-C subfamily serine protease
VRALSLAVLVAAAAWVSWYLLRPVVPEIAPPAAATSRSLPKPDTAAVAAPPGDAGSSASAGQAPGQPPPAVRAAADEHQSGKIARGFSEHGGSGLLVSAAPPGSMTEQLRLQPGDIVVTVNGEAVASIDDFVRIYRAEGLPSELTILRQGREMHLH